jgi:hypothetical protein
MDGEMEFLYSQTYPGGQWPDEDTFRLLLGVNIPMICRTGESFVILPWEGLFLQLPFLLPAVPRT